MKNYIAPAAALALLLSALLTGCAGQAGGEKADASPPAVTESGDIEATPETPKPDMTAAPETAPLSEQPIDFTYDEASCTPWQLAYIALLEDLCGREKPVRLARTEGNFDENEIKLSSSYCLYDVDKDGIPEMFVRFGNCEAEYVTEVYACRDEAAVYIGNFGAAHSGLYTWPGENAALFVSGHMGYATMEKLSVIDQALVTEEIFSEDISQDQEAEYTAADKIVPGSVYLDEFRTMLTLPEYTPLTLPIYDYFKTETPQGGAAADGDARKTISEVLAGGRELYGVTADGFGGDTGLMTFADYCQPGAVYQYARQPLQIQKTSWVDFNRDGKEECILYMGEPDDTGSSDDLYVILSEQDGAVYAYCINYVFDNEVFQDGVFVTDYDWSYGISFYKNQCYEYPKPHDPDAPAVAWEPYGG